MVVGSRLNALIKIGNGGIEGFNNLHQGLHAGRSGLQQSWITHGRDGLVNGVDPLLNPLLGTAVVSGEEIVQLSRSLAGLTHFSCSRLGQRSSKSQPRGESILSIQINACGKYIFSQAVSWLL